MSLANLFDPMNVSAFTHCRHRPVSSDIRWLGALRCLARRCADLTQEACKPLVRRRFARITLTAASCLVAACAAIPHGGDGIAKVNPSSIAAAPATWDGREVQIVGLVVFEGGSFGLYQSYGAYCRGAEHAGIHVLWQDWPGVSPKDSRRRAIVRGVFRNRTVIKQPDGSAVISTNALGPGPLEPGSIVRWLSNPAPPCPNRQ